MEVRLLSFWIFRIPALCRDKNTHYFLRKRLWKKLRQIRGLTPLKGEKDQQRRGLDWALLPNGKEKDEGLFWIIKKWLVSESTLKKRTAWTSKDLSWIFENMARCPQGPALSVIFLWKILQTVGNLLAKERGGPSRKAIRSAVTMIKVNFLRRFVIFSAVQLLITACLR
jgi:hypothetical protein